MEVLQLHIIRVKRLFDIGIKTLELEETFNKIAGFTIKYDKLPEFMYTDTLYPNNTVFDIEEERMSKAMYFK